MAITAHSAEVTVTSGEKRLSLSVDSTMLPQRLWFRCWSDALPDTGPLSLDCALVGLLHPAMKAGQDLVIDGPVTPELLFAAQTDLQALLRDHDPSLQPIRVWASQAYTPPKTPASHTVTGFSAGVDSFSTYARYRPGSAAPNSLALTGLAVFDVQNIDGKGEGFGTFVTRLRSFAQAQGLAWFAVSSNLDAFYSQPDSHHQRTHTLKNAAAALSLQEVIGRYYYSSAHEFAKINQGADDMAYIDPMVLGLLSASGLQFQSSCAGLTRIEKTHAVAQMPEAHALLDVCVGRHQFRLPHGKPNCSRCWKCGRTLFTLETMGALASFGEVFDLKLFKANRARVFYRLALQAVGARSSMDAEVLRAMKAQGTWQPSDHVLVALARLHATARRIKSLKSLYLVAKSWVTRPSDNRGARPARPHDTAPSQR